MAKTYTLHVAGLTRELPICKINDHLDIAAFIMFSDVELTIACAKALLEKCPDFDVILTAEAKGICLCYEMSRLLGMKEFIVARKSLKPYMQDALSHKACSITTQKEQTLYLNGCDAEKIRGKRVALIADVIATGESLAAIEGLAVEAGAQVVARAAILAELGAVKRDDIIFLKEHFVFTPHEDGTFTPISVD